MPLAAATVVDALAALLAPQAGLGAGGVKTSRAWPWAESDLPACRVFVTTEAVQRISLDGTNEHDLSVAVQYAVRSVADLDDAMSDLASAGITLLFAGTPPYQLQLTRIDRSMSTEGEAAVGLVVLQLQCIYFVAPHAPNTIIS